MEFQGLTAQTCSFLSTQCPNNSSLHQSCGISLEWNIVDDKCGLVCETENYGFVAFPNTAKCNGVTECLTGQDEVGCNNDSDKMFVKCPSYDVVISNADYCNQGYFVCPYNLNHSNGYSARLYSLYVLDEVGCNHTSGIECNTSLTRMYGVQNVRVYAWIHPALICDHGVFYENRSKMHCDSNEDELGCDNHTNGKWCQSAATPGNMKYIFNNQLCTNPNVMFLNQFDLTNFQFCSDWSEHMNCSDTSDVALWCRVNGSETTLSKYLVCARGENCDTGLDEACDTVGYECHIHKHRLCDGVNDCEPYGEDEDENMCNSMVNETCERRLTLERQTNFKILKSWLNDNVSDCIDNKDEMEKYWTVCGQSDRIRWVDKNETCRDVFKCPGLGNYIELTELCDKVESCRGNLENAVCSTARDHRALWSTPTKITENNYIGPCLPGIFEYKMFQCGKEYFTKDTNIYGIEPLLWNYPNTSRNCESFYGTQYLFLSCMDVCSNTHCMFRRATYDACATQNIPMTLLNGTNIIRVSKDDGVYKNNILPCNNGMCVSIDQVCDLANDCGDGSDEANCTNHFRCTSGEYVTIDRKCDGSPQCLDLSDECNEHCGDKLIKSPVLLVAAWIIGILSSIINIVVIVQNMKKIISIGIETPAFKNTLFIMVISLGDLLVGVYLVSIAVIDYVLGDDYCKKMYKWLSSLECSILGMASTIGAQVSLLAMTVLSFQRANSLRNIFQARDFTKKDAFRCISIACAVIFVAIIISSFPEIPSFENYFTNGMQYNNIPLFVGSVTKKKHTEIFESYYGRLQSRTLSWDTIRTMVQQMFSQDHGGVSGTKIGFYGNDGVCLFKYFVTADDPQKIFSLVLLFFNFICFLIISLSYIIVIVVSRSSGKATKGGDKNDAASKRDRALQRKISLIILSDFTCWVPFIIIGILHFSDQIDASKYYEFCSIIILPINSLINPIIYNSEFLVAKQYVTRHVSRIATTIRRPVPDRPIDIELTPVPNNSTDKPASQ